MKDKKYRIWNSVKDKLKQLAHWSERHINVRDLKRCLPLFLLMVICAIMSISRKDTYATMATVGAIVLVVLHCCVVPIRWADSKAATFQMIVQLMIYTFIYLTMVTTGASLGNNRLAFVNMLIYFDVIGIMAFVGLSRQCLVALDLEITTVNAVAMIKIITFVWYGLYVAMCCVNFSLVSVFPGSYEGVEGIDYFTTAFNVVYYTFSVMFTYSGEGIRAVGIITRFVEMVEVAVSYIIVGIVIVNMLGKAIELRLPFMKAGER